jgi:hypothetical protein
MSEPTGAYVPRTTTDAERVLAMVRDLRDERDVARQVVVFHERDLADLRRRIESALPYLRAIQNKPSAEGDSARWAGTAEGLLATAENRESGASDA